jgi:hypothetical protein
MPVDNHSHRLVIQRVRNRVIDVLECFASFEQQLEYARSVPICYVPYELICTWQSNVPSARPAEFAEPVFTRSERDAVAKFHAAWDRTSAAIPTNFPPLNDVLRMPEWASLRDAASEALAVFNVRGRLSEEIEIS